MGDFMMRTRSRHGCYERGETLLSVIVSIGLSAVLFAATYSSFMNSTRNGFDHEVRIRAIEEANAVLDLMAYDLRMLGSGMPLGQTKFAITDVTLQPATLPVLTTSNATYISFRMNEKGITTMLTADFNPAAGSTLSVFSASGFKVGNAVYLNNATPGGEDGCMASVTAVAGNTLTLGGKIYSPGALFRAGSLVDTTVTVTYFSPPDNGGIRRAIGTDSVLLAPKSSFSITYLDIYGNVITPPLTSQVIADSLGGLRLTVNVQGSHQLKSGQNFTAQAVQTVGFRNLNVSR